MLKIDDYRLVSDIRKEFNVSNQTVTTTLSRMGITKERFDNRVYITNDDYSRLHKKLQLSSRVKSIVKADEVEEEVAINYKELILEERIKGLKEEIKLLKENVESKYDDIEFKKLEIINLNKRIDSQNIMIAESKNAIFMLETSKHDELADKDNEISKLNKDIISKDSEIDTLSSSVVEQNHFLEKLKNEIENETHNKEAALNEIIELKAQIDSFNNRSFAKRLLDVFKR